MSDEIGYLAGLGGLGLMKKAYSDLGDVGEDALTYMIGEGADLGPGGLAGYIRDQQQFVPYGVTTATGSSFGMATDPVTGEVTYGLNLSEDERARQQRLFGLSDDILGQVGGSVQEREQAVFDRMMQGMSPEMERQRLALEQRLQAQGRGGVMTNMFGGTPEQLAMAKGQQEALNNAYLNAMQFAGQEQTRLANLGTGLMNQGYVPQTMLLQGITPGMTAAEQRRDQQNIQMGNFADAYVSGIQAQLAANQARAGMLGGLGTSLAEGALGLFDS